MYLQIKQKRSSLFIDKFEIFENELLIYTAKSLFFSNQKEIKVLNLSDKEEISIKNESTWDVLKYKIDFKDGLSFCMDGKSSAGDVYIIMLPEGTIEVYHQKGLRLSLFRGEQQIADISKNKKNILNGNEFNILANSDVNKKLLIAVCLVWKMHNFSDNSSISIISVNYGKLNNAKKISPDNWYPVK